MLSREFDNDNDNTELKKLRQDNAEIRENLRTIEQQRLANNLIIGGIPYYNEPQRGDTASPPNTQEHFSDTRKAVNRFFTEVLQIPEDDAKNIRIEITKRIGAEKNNKPKNVLLTFQSLNDKEKVISCRDRLKGRDEYMHDQFPKDVVERRRNLIPVMLAARKDGQNAYLRYDKLIVNGSHYTNGKYGKAQ